MPERWVGVAVSGDRVTMVDAEVPDVGPIVIQSDQSLKLQSGNSGRAYAVIHQQVADYIRDNEVSKVVIKASAHSKSTTLAHLMSAELRGVIISAAGSQTEVMVLAKAVISKTFGKRKVDEYIKDEDFWNGEVAGKALRAGSREAAMMLLSARKGG